MYLQPVSHPAREVWQSQTFNVQRSTLKLSNISIQMTKLNKKWIDLEDNNELDIFISNQNKFNETPNSFSAYLSNYRILR